MNIESFQEIVYETDENGIVTVTINCPERKNALSPRTFLELWWAMDMYENDKNMNALILTGVTDPNQKDARKQAFSSGGFFSPNDKATFTDEEKAQLDPTDIAQKKLSVKMWGLDKPVISAINGMAIGAGFTMPFVGSDLIYMADSAFIRLPFVRLGIVPELAMTYLLPRMIGFQKAREILYFGKDIEADKAEHIGLVNGVFPADDLMKEVKAIAFSLVPPQGSGVALRATKKAINKSLIDQIDAALDNENEGLNKAMASPDFIEAVMARAEKREPKFKG